MKMQLIKTLLSRKPSSESVMTGLISYLILLIVFLANNPVLKANALVVYEHGEYWRAFTTTLMHADFVHLGHNTLFFILFSVLLNSYFGFWIFPVASLISGGIINLIALKVYDPHIYIVGISGVIYYMAAFWMTMYVLLERQHKISKRLIISIAVSLILFWPDAIEERVSYLSHGLGFTFGLISALIYFYFRKENLRRHEVWKEKITYVDDELEAEALSFDVD